MNRPFLVAAMLFAFVASCPLLAFSQNSAPLSHFVFDDNFDGDIIINEVRVPQAGEAMYTYYEALGWRGKRAGYAGIQAHPKSHLYIFSIWDRKPRTAPIQAVYRGPGTETVGFGGGRYSVNSWDLVLGKRSHNYRSNWNGGVQSDETGEFYFMLSGGAKTAPTTANPSKFAISRQATEPNYGNFN